MKIIAIETSGIVASVALLDESKVISEITLNYKQSHSTTVMPMIQSLCNLCEFNIEDIDYIACTCGPGSFTGLRIGASIATGIAHSLNKKIIPVSTLEVLAYNIFITDRDIVPIIDARSERIFTSIYKWEEGNLKNIYPDCATNLKDLLAYIKEKGINPIFLGDGALKYKDIIKGFDNNYIFAPICQNMQRAGVLGNLAFEYIKKSKFVDYNNFEIQYFRSSQAERELNERKQ